MQINSRFPVITVDGTAVAVMIGTPTVEFGDEVILNAHHDRKAFGTMYVAGVDTELLGAIAPDVLALWNLGSTAEMHTLLERCYGTGLPANIAVTIYTLIEHPVEEVL